MREAGRRRFGRSASSLELPALLGHQVESFEWLASVGISEALSEVTFSDGGERLEMSLFAPRLGSPELSVERCVDLGFSYNARLMCSMRIRNLVTGEISERADVRVCMIPVMTEDGSFIISGSRRVIVSQFVRAPGVYFSMLYDPKSGDELAQARFLPRRGTRLLMEMSGKRVLSAQFDGGRRFNAATLVRALGFSRDTIEEMCAGLDPSGKWLTPTLNAAGGTLDSEDACLEHLLGVLEPGAPSSPERGREHLRSLLMSPERVSLGELGRRRLNESVHGEGSGGGDTLSAEDVFAIFRNVALLQMGGRDADDVDHLGNRRVRRAGELIAESFRQGLVASRRATVERLLGMNTEELMRLTPGRLVSFDQVERSVRGFFSSSPLCQFLDNSNLLSEITHKRRITALGPGGIDRRRAGIDVRDVHHSYYGRVCPIESPEGQNIGLVSALAAGATLDGDGFILAPYLRVKDTARSGAADIVGRTADEDVLSPFGEVLARAGERITGDAAAELSDIRPAFEVAVAPYVSDEVVRLSAFDEELFRIGQATVGDNGLREVESGIVEARYGGEVVVCDSSELDYVDLSVRQMFSVSTLMIPFLNHNDANRALMGANMQRQALPLMSPDAPRVSTGMEGEISHSPGHSVWAVGDGTVVHASADMVSVSSVEGDSVWTLSYPLTALARSNQNTLMSQRARVRSGQFVRAGDCLADGYASDSGRMALGQNVLVAFMSWEGFNYEDSIVVSERVISSGRFRSMHVKDHDVILRKESSEEITRDVPNIAGADARNMGADGLVMVGVRVSPGDVLVGKRTPRADMTSEEALLIGISDDPLIGKWRDTSLFAGKGDHGVIVNSRMVTGGPGDPLPPGARAMARVSIARARPLAVGDKMSGRHGNKGLVSVVLPVEDMPTLPDGTPADVVLNPLGVPSRMNLGQLMEVHLGMASAEAGFYAETPAFDGASWLQIQDALAEASAASRFAGDGPALSAWMEWAASLPGAGGDGSLARAALLEWLSARGEDVDEKSGFELLSSLARRRELDLSDPSPVTGKFRLRDGRSGDYLPGCQTAGVKYMLKLSHLADDKMHARSVGTYQEITQQPLGGKSHGGGQRLGEMEVWALESYGAAYNLLETMTVKSDDMEGRIATYASILEGDGALSPRRPESFRVLAAELAALGISIEADQASEFGGRGWFAVSGEGRG